MMIDDDCTKRRRSVQKAQWPDDQKSVLALSSPFLLQPTTTSSVSPVLKQRTKAKIYETRICSKEELDMATAHLFHCILLLP